MTASAENIFLAAALHYAREWKWRVFPVEVRGKRPLTKNGCLDATLDETQIRAWWQEFPNANVGIATGKESNLAVVDIDVHKGANSGDLFVGGLGEEIYKTVGIQTGGGGLQFYYTFPTDFDLRNSTSQIGKWIDIRGEGGYVVAPPSIHETGNVYVELDENPDDATLLPFPVQWIEKLRSLKSGSNSNGNGNHGVLNDDTLYVAPPSTLVVPDAIAHGSRNDTLTRIAGSLRRIDLDQAEIQSVLNSVNHRVCQPPLDSAEVHRIAQSVAKYSPADLLEPAIDDEDKPDYENTLQPYVFGDFLDMEFEAKEVMAFHIGKRDIAIIQAATNAGKTTYCRNATLCMAAGRPFYPVYDGARPIKVAYFDFENDAQDVQRDLKLMYQIFTDAEKENIKKNLIVIPKGLKNGELFQFNTHEKWANTLITANKVEFIIVDNVSAAYDLNDENSNAEVTKKVIKPLLKMAYKGNCAFLFAHHYGKTKNELESAGVHAGRGASALQALSRTVINMFGDVSKGEPVTIECAKRKTDGGQNYREVFKLEEDRWFHQTMIVPPPKKQTAYAAIREFMESIVYPNLVSTADIITAMEDRFGADMVKKAVNELYKDGFIERPKHGQYCSKDLSKTSDFQKATETIKGKNFYEVSPA